MQNPYCDHRNFDSVDQLLVSLAVVVMIGTSHRFVLAKIILVDFIWIDLVMFVERDGNLMR
jgi:hypothetical protein